MINVDIIRSIIEEIDTSLQKGYLSDVQVQVLKDRMNLGSTYKELRIKYNISGNTALSHCLLRTCKFEHWHRGMDGEDESYLSKINQDYFVEKIICASEDKNCIPAIYAVSLAYYLKKRRFSRAFLLLTHLKCLDLAMHCTNICSN